MQPLSCKLGALRWETHKHQQSEPESSMARVSCLTFPPAWATRPAPGYDWKIAAHYYAWGRGTYHARRQRGHPDDPKSDDPKAQTPAMQRFRTDSETQQALANTAKLSSVTTGNYDAVFYPGGHGPLWDLAEDRDSIGLIERLYAEGKPVAAVCHGPAVLRRAKAADGTPLVKGKNVTGFANSEEAAVGLTNIVPFLVEDALKAGGGKYSKAADWADYSVSDGNLITGQNPARGIRGQGAAQHGGKLTSRRAVQRLRIVVAIRSPTLTMVPRRHVCRHASKTGVGPPNKGETYRRRPDRRCVGWVSSRAV